MRAYLDNGATTKVDAAVVREMEKYFSDIYANPSSTHTPGQEARRAVEEAREAVAGKINASHDEIIFTSGGTESDNLAIKGVAYANRERGNHIITTKIEHPAILRSCEALEKEGFTITYIGVDKEGFVNVTELKKAINDKTILVSVIHGNNEIGTIQDIDEIGKICKEKKVLFHTDAVQSFTKVPINVKKTNVDLISISSHKIHGPKGVGALYVRKGTKIKKLADGGGHEFKIRAGTENVPGIMGFAKAVKISSDSDSKKIAKLRDLLTRQIEEEISDVKTNGPRGEKRLCNNVNISFANIEGEALGAYLDTEGICTSTGSACSSHSLEPSHVLLAIGLSKELANGTMRMTLSRYTTEEEINFTVEQLKKYTAKLRKISPLTRVLKNVL